jgi:hypothetical protein
MLERLTKSDSRFVNTFFEVGMIGALTTGTIRIILACWRQSGLADAIGVTVIGIVLWCVTLGLYRLWKG